MTDSPTSSLGQGTEVSLIIEVAKQGEKMQTILNRLEIMRADQKEQAERSKGIESRLGVLEGKMNFAGGAIAIISASIALTASYIIKKVFG